MISPLRARWFALAMTYCLTIGAPVWSQSQGLRFAHLSIIGDRLSNETVTGIVQDDDDGFLWFGTEDGLNRYDGYTFTVFKHQPDDSLSIYSNTIGYSDSTTFNSIPGAAPLIPKTGGSHPPIGYRLPQSGEYAVVLNNFSDTMTHFAVFMDSTIIDYTRSDAHPSESDYLTFGNGLTVSNRDTEVKNADIRTIIVESDNEKVIGMRNTSIPQNDSVLLELLNRRDMKIVNTGDTVRYDLKLHSASTVESLTLSHSNIAILPNSSQLILPDWESPFNGPLKILIDHGNDGTIYDSLFVSNEESGWFSSPKMNAPISLAFLGLTCPL